MIGAEKPDVVIHCAAASAVDRCELDHDYAHNGNVITTINLCEALRQAEQGKLIFISTDYVFAGSTAAPCEDVEPAPLNQYGRSKLQAENLVRNSGVPFSIFRVCALYTAEAHPKGDPVTTIHQTVASGETYKAATDLCSNPTECSDLARAITKLIKASDLPSVLHLASAEYLSRYEFAVKVATRLQLGSDAILPVKFSDLALPAPRPLKAGLGSHYLESLLGYSLTPFSQLPGISR